MKKEKSLFLILDGNAILHRAFYALPRLTTKDKKPINAVYGFLLVLFKVIREFRPDYLAVAFDFPAPTFRSKIFKEYKAHRPKAPQEFYQQIPVLKEILQNFKIKIFEKEGYEADDVIGTICEKIKKNDQKIQILIVTGDADMLQLVDENIQIYLLKRGIKDINVYDKEKVLKEFEILPQYIPDFKALFGDPSDNIPGVVGIGKKTALSLIKEFSSLENLYQAILKEKEAKKIGEKIKEKLLENKERAFLSKKLAKIEREIPLLFDLADCELKKLDLEKAKKVLSKFGFKSLLERLPKIFEGLNSKEDLKQQTLL